jgi:hypothetical protein
LRDVLKYVLEDLATVEVVLPLLTDAVVPTLDLGDDSLPLQDETRESTLEDVPPDLPPAQVLAHRVIARAPGRFSRRGAI